MKDGVFQTDFSSEPVYKIQSIRREDAGVYQCVARNAVGSIFSEQVQVLVACEFDTFLLPLHPFLLGFLSSSGNSREKERKNTLLMNCFSSRLDMSPFSEQTETSLTVQAGEAAVMEVAAVESQPKPAVTWEAEDGSPLYGHKYALGPDSQLVILSVSESDQKLYR